MAVAAFVLAFHSSVVCAKEIKERIYLVPAGNVDGAILAYLKDRIPQALPMSSGVAVEAGRELPAAARGGQGATYGARQLLDGLSGGITIALTNERAVIITDAGLHGDGGEAVDSFSDPGLGISVVSLYRMKGDPAGPRVSRGVLSERALRETLRAIGLSLGLSDCRNKRCAMCHSAGPADGGRNASYCYGCKIALERKVSGGTLLGDKIEKAVNAVR